MSDSTAVSRAHRARGRGTRALGEAVAALTQPVIARRGFARGALVAEWPAIVGERLAGNSVPERIAYPPKRSSDGTLHLRVASGSLAMELQHLEPILIEKINAYFGHRAVARVRLTQGPMPTPMPARAAERPQPPQHLSDRQEADLDARLAGIDEPSLRGVLASLGRAVIGKTHPRSPF